MKEDYYDKYYEGVFWSIDYPNHKVQGTLYIDKGGEAQISTFNNILPKNTEVKPFDTIYAEVSLINEDKSFSIKFYNTFYSGNIGDVLKKIKYYSSDILISSFDKDIKEDKYSTLSLNANFINEYVPIYGTEIPLNNEEDDKQFSSNINYKQPVHITLFQDDKMHIYFYFSANIEYKPRYRRVSFSEDILLNVDMNESVDKERLFDLKTLLLNLFKLLLNENINFTKIEIQSTNKKWYYKLNTPETQAFFLNKTTVVKYDNFIDNSQNKFEKWFKLNTELHLIVESFFSVYHQKGVMHRNRFLTYVSILENYYKNKIRKNGDLFSAIKYLMKESKTLPISIKDNIDTISEKIKNSRHYYAHLEEKRKKKSFDETELFAINKALEKVIREILLREIGITAPENKHHIYKVDTNSD